VKQHLKEHPEINTTVPQQLLSDAGYEMLYTPPYVSQLQPIELIWAFTKSLVARQSHRTRSVQEAAVQTRQAMDAVTAQLCRKVITHCHTWIDTFMHSDAGGSLQQYADLEALVHAAAAGAGAGDVAGTSAAEEEEEEEEEEDVDARWAQ
jgi:hypothetical protein